VLLRRRLAIASGWQAGISVVMGADRYKCFAPLTGRDCGGSYRSVLPERVLGKRLLLDSRGVDVPMAYNPAFVMLSSLKPLFFDSLKNEFRFSDSGRA
jgi:hypothetical protein